MKRMKRTSLIAGAALAVAATIAGVWAAEKPKAELISGEITCMYCHLARADMGSNADGCVARCIEKKMMPPILVQEGTGEIFVVVGKDGESAVKRLLPNIGKKVNVQGPVYRKGGLNMIEINVISEAM